ncbi:hypothetical protein, partial [Acinetobacter pittii]|uniref:hypothetical protein n=1 Tax=Acinetobacter pittii TaxID=48296 RepID=UPI001BDB98EF
MIDLGLRAGAYGDRSEHRLSLATLREHPHGIDLGPLRPNLARWPPTTAPAMRPRHEGCRLDRAAGA